MDLYTILIIVFVVLLLLRIITPSKGVLGEKRVSRILNRLDQEEYKIIHDLTLKTYNGSSQIDHLIISIYGIFVIETKNYTGWIHGAEKSEYWMQNIYQKKYKFRNPIKQNWSHIYALKQTLKNYNNIIYFPIVVFAGSAVLKNIHTTSPVIYTHRLFEKIHDLSKSINLSKEQINEIHTIIVNNNIEDKIIKKEHIRAINEKIKNNIINENKQKCPKCGNNLILREGKYGQFYGCSNYPNCRYTMKK